jgi:AraC family transcriptional regulator
MPPAPAPTNPEFIPGSAGERFGHVVGTRAIGEFVLRESRYAPSLILPAHCHPQPYFAFVARGSMRERSRGGERQYGARTVHFHSAGEPHADRMEVAGVTCLSVVAYGGIAKRLGSAGAGGEDDPELARLAARCHREFGQNDAASDLALESLALDLVATLLRACLRERGPRPPRWLDDVRARLHDAPAEPVTLSQLSRLAGVHPVSLVRAFRRHTGTTPGAYVRRLRLEVAARALVETDAPIAEIALAAGFASQAHFTRMFALRHGVPPGAYRRQRRR